MNEQLLVDIALLIVVLILGIAAIEVRSLFAACILSGIYSLMMAMVYANLHAMDVSYTEAAVGAGISTVLILGALSHVGRLEKVPKVKVDLRGLAVVFITGAFLIYGTLDMPAFGDPKAPVHTHRAAQLIEQRVGKPSLDPQYHQQGVSAQASLSHDSHDAQDEHGPIIQDDFEGHVPNMVTSVLATYRGFDTMFETHVILIAGISMLLLLRREPRLKVEST